MLDKTALVHNLSPKSKTGFTERLYDDPDQVVPAMLDKTAFKKPYAVFHCGKCGSITVAHRSMERLLLQHHQLGQCFLLEPNQLGQGFLLGHHQLGRGFLLEQPQAALIYRMRGRNRISARAHRALLLRFPMVIQHFGQLLLLPKVVALFALFADLQCRGGASRRICCFTIVKRYCSSLASAPLSPQHEMLHL